MMSSRLCISTRPASSAQELSASRQAQPRPINHVSQTDAAAAPPASGRGARRDAQKKASSAAAVPQTTLATGKSHELVVGTNRLAGKRMSLYPPLIETAKKCRTVAISIPRTKSLRRGRMSRLGIASSPGHENRPCSS
jgi:hypothetical protein